MKDNKKEKLFSVSIKDCRVEAFTASGDGGQHRNRVKTAIRLTHQPSGAVVEAKEERSQLQNKRNAIKRLGKHPKFKLWCKIKASELLTGKTIEQRVEESMSPENIKVEVKDQNNKWIIDNG